MSLPAALPRTAAPRANWIAYALAAATTLLWIACALPSGVPEGGSLRDDAGTPLGRQGWMLVPALVLLVLSPVASALATGRQARLTVLAAVDAFVALYCALLLTLRRGLAADTAPLTGLPLVLLVALYVVGGLSLIEVRRLLAGRLGPPSRGLSGARLAVCLLVLLLPSLLLLHGSQERASLLAPFVFVAVSAAGARLSRGPAGLALTAALLHTALAAHVLVTLRYTLAHEAPRVPDLSPVGRATLDGATVLLGLAGLQVLVALALALRRSAGPVDGAEADALSDAASEAASESASGGRA